MRPKTVMSGVWAGVRRNLTMTIALVLSTAIALAFVGAAYLASVEISKFQEHYEGRLNVSVFLCPSNGSSSGQCAFPAPTSRTETASQRAAQINSYLAEQAATIGKQLKADPRVQSYSFVSELAQYKNALQIEPPGVAKQIHVGDLGASYTVVLKNIQNDFDGFAATYTGEKGVFGVSNRVDSLKALLKIIDGARFLSIAVAIVVLIASILLIANTIQVAAAQRRNETSIMRLVGASRWMTELPFMLETIFATVVGGLVSVGLLAIGKQFVLNGIFKSPVEHNVIPNLNINDILVAGGIGLIAGIVLSAITAFATLRLYVRL